MIINIKFFKDWLFFSISDFTGKYKESQRKDTTNAWMIIFLFSFSYFDNDRFSSIRCSVFINQLFLYLLETQPHRLIPEKEKRSSQIKGKRMRKITHYIDEHYSEKLLLSDIAEQQKSMLTTQDFLSDDASLLMLEKYTLWLRRYCSEYLWTVTLRLHMDFGSLSLLK